MSTRVKLKVQGLANSQIQSGAYALILVEDEGSKRIPIIIGTTEAQSIAIALEHLVPPRPLTHDLFASFSKAVDVTLKEVYIYKFEDGVFYSELRFMKDDQIIAIDSRTSDAIAIALRLNCEIYTSTEILEECGVLLEDSYRPQKKSEEHQLLEMDPAEISDPELLKKWVHYQTSEKIQQQFERAITDEDYELAKLFKDELARREKEDDTNA